MHKNRQWLGIVALAALTACGGGGSDADPGAGSGAEAPPGEVAVPAEAAVPAASLPPVDRSRIAASRPGSDTLDVNYTGEMPYRDAGAIGAFRTVCTFSHFNFDDPLVFPGQADATHLHMYFGNTAVDHASTPQSIASSGSSTCRGGIANRSAYWAPALLDTGTGAPVVPTLINVYYKTGYFGVRDADVRPWPNQFRMIAGNSKSTGAQRSIVSYRCNAGSDNDFIPSCSGTLMMTVRFPQCWDGRNLSSPDHRSHVRHPLPGQGCRAGEVATPELSINIEYPVSGGVSYRLSSDISGAPPGSSGHADWVKGWDPEVMQTFVTQVINRGLSGGSHLIGDGRAMGCAYRGCR